MPFPARYRYHIGKQVTSLCSMLGLSPAVVLRRAGLSENCLEQGVDPAQYFALWEAAEAETKDPDLGITLGKRMPHLPFSSALVAFSCSDSIRVGLQRLALFKPLIAPIRIDHGPENDGYHIRFLPLHPSLRFSALLSTYEVVFFTELCRHLTGETIHPLVARTVAPSDALEDFLGCKTDAGDAPELVFRIRDAALPLISENADIWRGLEPILQKRIVDMDAPANVSDRVRAELVELLPSGRSSVDDVCRRLNLGRRNLQHRLNAEGTSFRTVLDEVRRNLALTYLQRDSMRVEEVSYLLGFSDPNSFYRAFRKWTGMTPIEARNKT